MGWLVLGVALYLLYGGPLSKKKKPRPPEPAKPPPDPAVEARRRAREVLEVEPDATPASVRRAYQAKIKQYHPDRVAGAAPEIQALAEARTKQFNEAYEILQKAEESTK